MLRRNEIAEVHYKLIGRGDMSRYHREEAMYRNPYIVVCSEIAVMLRGRFKKSKGAANKIQTPCNERLDALSTVRGSSQTQGAFHGRFYRYLSVTLVFPPGMHILLLHFGGKCLASDLDIVIWTAVSERLQQTSSRK